MDVDGAIELAEAWRDGRMVGGDHGEVIELLLTEVETLRAISPPDPNDRAYIQGRGDMLNEILGFLSAHNQYRSAEFIVANIPVVKEMPRIALLNS